MSDEILLNRGSFDVFGDMLFVLIGNAARHGKTDGQIDVSGHQYKDHNNYVVVVEVTSEVVGRKEHQEAVARIKSAMQMSEARAIERAAVEEGFSGLKKLGGVLRRVRFPNVSLVVLARESDLRITFRLTLPAEITFTRGRA